MSTPTQNWETTVGRVTTEIRLESLKDMWLAENGQLPRENVRRLTLSDALVDTGASDLSLPSRLIQQLGLKQWTTRTACTPVGLRTFNIYEPVRLTILGRDCTVDVAEVTDDAPVLIGQVPLELLDLVLDPKRGQLIPAHGDTHLIDML
jgi:predicted aspartyl protease